MRGRVDEFRALGAEPYAVNSGDALTAKAFLASLDLPFDVLVDQDGAVAAAYGAIRADNGRCDRLVVVVGRDGRVLHRQAGRVAPDDLLSVLRAAGDEAVATPA